MAAKSKTNEKDLIKEMLLFAEKTINSAITEKDLTKHLKKHGFSKIDQEGILKEKFEYFAKKIWPKTSSSGSLLFDLSFYPYILEINKLSEIKKVSDDTKKYAFRAAELLAIITAVLIIYLMFMPFTAELIPRQESILRDIDEKIQVVEKEVAQVGKQLGVVEKQVSTVEKKVKKSWLLR